MASLDALPSPVTQKICDYVANITPRDALPRYATISRAWQLAIERHTFRDLYLSSARLDALADVVTGHRRGYVRVVTLHVALASYPRHQRNDQESAEDGTRTTRVLASSVQVLFATLAKWDSTTDPSAGIHVELLIESPSDEVPGALARGSRGPPTTRRAMSSIARLDLPRRALPRVHIVSALTCSGRHIELSSVLFLVSRLPRLQVLDTEIEHDTAGERDLEQRRGFVLGLSHYARNITDFRLRRPVNTFDSPRAPSKEARMLFYSTLRQYTQRCVSLTFDDSIDVRGLFSAFKGDRARLSLRTLPWWPRLERLQLRNSYMMRRPYARVHTLASALKNVEEVILLVGRAVRCMPAVKVIRVRQYVLAEGSLEQSTVKYGVDSSGRASVVFAGLQPSQDTLDAWTASVKATRGVDLDIRVHVSSAHDDDDQG